MQTDEVLRILIVDDEPANLLALEALLEELSPHLVRARSGEDAIKQAEEQEFAVILLDVQMPGIDGYETGRILRSRPRSQFTPIIFLTAFDSDAASQARAYGLGAVDFLVKPLNSFVLRAKVRVFVELFRKTERIKQLEKQQFQQRLAEEKRSWEQTAHLVSRTFAESTSEESALRTVLRTLCEQLKCDAATLWTLDGDSLRCKDFWQSPAVAFPRLEAESRVESFTQGVGLPGRVWEQSGLVWIDHFAREVQFPRFDAARAEGVATAVGLPLVMGQEFLGVVEFFSRGRLQPDNDLTATLLDIGTQIGPFLHRMHSARALAHSEAVKSAVLNAALDSIVTINEQGRVIEWNPAAERTFGYAREEAIGKPISELIVPSYLREAHNQGMARYLATGEGPVLGTLIELPAIRSDGREIEVELAINPIHLGSESLFTAYLRDVTERNRSDQAILESEGRLQLAVEIAEMGTFEIDLLTDRVTVNEPGRLIYGWPTGQTTFSTVQSHFHPDDREHVLRRVGEALNPAGAGTFEVEQRIYRTDGNLRWLRVRGKAFFDGEGALRKAVRCVGTYLDVTDRKLAEETLKEADRRKDEFLALLAHELRNPLAPLRNGLEVLRLAADDHDVVLEARLMMERQLGHMVRIIDDLLDISRITRNKLELRPDRILFSNVIANALETVGLSGQSMDHKLVVSIPPEPIYLHADLTRLAQVFANLLTNSVKFTPPGGSIWLTATQLADSIVVEIKDTGIGIPTADVSKIFEMFSQVDRSLERTSGGLGIGLALVKGLLEMHGGTVVASSAGHGLGSSFTVTLPTLVDAFESTTEGEHTETMSPDVTKHRILVVDDNQDSAHSMALMLRALGNEVALAHDGVEAVAATETFRPQVILMDIGMPKLNGFEATRQIRGEPWGRDIVVIALTGWGNEHDRQLSQAAGCDAHLVKPVELSELKQMIEQLRSTNRGRRDTNEKF